MEEILAVLISFCCQWDVSGLEGCWEIPGGGGFLVHSAQGLIWQVWHVSQPAGVLVASCLRLSLVSPPISRGSCVTAHLSCLQRPYFSCTPGRVGLGSPSLGCPPRSLQGVAAAGSPSALPMATPGPFCS